MRSFQELNLTPGDVPGMAVDDVLDYCVFKIRKVKLFLRSFSLVKVSG